MRSTAALIPLLFAVLTTALPAQKLGYDDTPFLPGGKWRVHDSKRPQPPVMEPGPFVALPRPKDAIVLFDGTDLSKWTGRNDKASWKTESGYMEVNRTGEIRTRDNFGSCQLHVEWASPTKVKGNSQGRGNSGVFLMGRYEIQVLDCYENQTYPDGQAASLYGQEPPSLNVCRGPGQWQTYDIFFAAPRFDDQKKLVSPARVTILHNGIIVQNNAAFIGSTTHKRVGKYGAHGPGPIKLQDHGNPVRFRNIWIRKL
ncbi:MAG: hypothetical protein CMJ83_13895 [Planctomycetes bacterium]|nr:hypothetical protein [Planctomycetota bacterium]